MNFIITKTMIEIPKERVLDMTTQNLNKQN